MRDRPATIEKPASTVRVALLGASMDMGWGVATSDTYENRLEDWLNEQARARGDNRHFEILNFAVAAYSPTQRLAIYRRSVRKFKPDFVIYATTLLDPRLTEIHLSDALSNNADLTGFDYLTSVVAEAFRRNAIKPVPASAETVSQSRREYFVIILAPIFSSDIPAFSPRN